jgi:hypothetical protein
MDGNLTMSINDMWGTVKGTNINGLEGYEAPKIYQDAKRQINERKYKETLEDQQKFPKKYWPIKKNDELVVFKRPNYLDDVIFVLYRSLIGKNLIIIKKRLRRH